MNDMASTRPGFTKKHGQIESVTSPRRIAAVEKQARALELRRAGQTYEAIAEKLGYKTRAGAHKAIVSALRRTLEEPAEELRKLEVLRLDGLLARLYPLATGDPPDLGAVDRTLKVAERRAKLLGLDSPLKIAPTQPDGQEPYPRMTEEEAQELVRAILGDNGQRPALVKTASEPGAEG